MSAVHLTPVAEQGLVLWLAVLAGLIAWRLLVVDRVLGGLLVSRKGGELDPERVQLLVVFLSGVGAYAAGALKVLAPGQPHAFPDVPQDMVSLFIGSQSLYLGGKLSRTVLKTS